LRRLYLFWRKTGYETELLTKTFVYPIWFNSYKTNRGKDNQNSGQIFQIELNKDKAIPIILSIIVDNYIPLRGKKIKDGYFLHLPLLKMHFHLDNI